MNFSMYIKTTLVFVLLFISTTAFANCASRLTATKNVTDFERIYCEIVDRGQGKTLPRFEDFRRNDVRVQRLLLKRPAQKLKIALPASTSKPKKKTVATPSESNPAEPKSTEPNSIAPVRERSSGIELSDCTLGKNLITCGQRRFGLVRNAPNSRLGKGVLSEHQRMALPRFTGDEDNDREVQLYLSEVYSHYIQRMMDIGLGASTMSFARFYHTFYDLKAKKVDFSERFETMYRFLKKDKQTMAVKSLPSHTRPHSLSQCDDISEQMIVCDIGSVNWVYLQ